MMCREKIIQHPNRSNERRNSGNIRHRAIFSKKTNKSVNYKHDEKNEQQKRKIMERKNTMIKIVPSLFVMKKPQEKSKKWHYNE
ncbi:hypothetical protein GCM10022250_34560 [Flavobacterium chungbukense]|uniref:Uncharacterized protein n=1 Tax=Flavobacterium chungbukense TaxID=877464 RepID=A0ABP7YKA9_9FLAO